MFAAGAGYGITAGDWFEGMTSGFAGGGAIRLGISESLFLGFSYNRQSLGVEASLKELCFEDYYDCVPLDWDVHLDEFYFMFGWMSPVLDYSSPFAYVELGFGGLKHVIGVGASVGDASASVETDETKFGMLIAAGGVFPLSREIGVNIEGTMRLTGEGGSGYDPYGYGSYSGSSGVLFGFRIGLAAMLGS